MTNVPDCVRDRVSEVELDMSETWAETRKYTSGLVRSGRVALVEFGLYTVVYNDSSSCLWVNDELITATSSYPRVPASVVSWLHSHYTM